MRPTEVTPAALASRGSLEQEINRGGALRQSCMLAMHRGEVSARHAGGLAEERRSAFP